MTYPLKMIAADKLRPYERNARTHSPEQIAQLKDLIMMAGFVGPILYDFEADHIIAGHGRVMAALELMQEGQAIPGPGRKGTLPKGKLPVIDGSGMTEAERRAFVIADNQVAARAGWNDELMALELKALEGFGFKTERLGFELGQLQAWTNPAQEEQLYSRKIEPPTYEPGERKPKVAELMDTTKRDQLAADILRAKLAPELEAFLLAAAERHVAFNFDLIADYYAQAEPELQRLFEASALVLIDFNAAIEGGFVKITEQFQQLFAEEYRGGTA